MSNYIYSLDSAKYGGEQKDFLKLSDTLLGTTVENFHSAVKEDKDLTKLFYNTLEFFGNTRHEIAKLHATDKAELFGMRRDQGKVFGCSMTPLYDPYHAYNPVVIETMQKHLKK